MLTRLSTARLLKAKSLERLLIMSAPAGLSWMSEEFEVGAAHTLFCRVAAQNVPNVFQSVLKEWQPAGLLSAR